MRRWCATLSVAAALAPAALPAQDRPFPLPVAIQVPVAPAPIASGAERYLCYELVLRSYLGDTATVQLVEVFGDRAEGTPLVRYEGAELAGNMTMAGPASETARDLAPASWKRIYVWVPIPAGQAVPARLVNRLTFAVGTGERRFVDRVDQLTRVAPATSAIVVGPPLKGGPWAVFNGPSNTSGHRRTPLSLGGRDALAQRYAIDYMKLAPNGWTFVGDSTRNESYPGNGEEVIAVADAVVSFVQTGVAENRPYITTRPDPFNLQTVIGNQVILDLGGGRYALYAHLLPGSITVEVGDRVQKGQTLGRVGNTGNSGGPHLHFHIIDDNVALGAEGLPYLIDGFDLVGKCAGTLRHCEVGPPTRLIHSTPLRDQVVRYP